MSATLIRTASEEETMAVAARLAGGLAAGSVVLLYGDLGAGKTAFVRGMVAGLGLDPDQVSSPTFTLIQEYRVGDVSQPATRLYHVDLYRLESAEIDDLGLEELMSSGGIAAIEWAEKLARPPEGAVRVRISEEGEEARRIEITDGDTSTED
jgi:tRNA threonylcarbamoyladenosine biosynthesis protein TsaE